jgi:hypothetical protein
MSTESTRMAPEEMPVTVSFPPNPKRRWRRSNLHPQVRAHIKLRACERRISEADLRALQRWIALEPEAPAGNWFKRFPSFTL